MARKLTHFEVPRRQKCVLFPSGGSFVPNYAISHDAAKAAVENEGRRCGLKGDFSALVSKIADNTLILVCLFANTHALEHLGAILDHGIDDNDLPFSVSETEGFRALRTSSGRDVDVSSRTWRSCTLYSICESQWEFLSPVFATLGKQYDLDNRVGLPVIDVVERKSETDSGWVAGVEFAAEHLPVFQPRFPKDVGLRNTSDQATPSVRCIIKRLQYKKDFDSERRILSHCNRQRHKHIVTLLASFTWQGKFCLILPPAESNLQELWKQRQSNEQDDFEPTMDWALQQIHGLADAIRTIHEDLTEDGAAMYGLHGDINASNVLSFSSSPTHHNGLGTLKLADFACGGLVSRRVSSAQFPPIPLIGTHQPPESLLGQARSRECDMWGFGCLVLEFVLWVVRGQAGLEEFSHSRLGIDYGFGIEFENDFFFEFCARGPVERTSPARTTQINAGVGRCIRGLRESVDRRQVHELLDVVEDGLLRVAPGDRMSSANLVAKLQRLVHGSGA